MNLDQSGDRDSSLNELKGDHVISPLFKRLSFNYPFV